MSDIYGDAIYVDENGVPFDRPIKPEHGANVEDWIAWQRAMNTCGDAVASCANRAFADAFRKAVRQ